MPNKYWGSVVDGYLVEGAKDKGYVKSGSGYPDKSINVKSSGWDEQRENDPSDWFEGKQGSKGRGEAS